jgi:lysophospholipase L1-like esterase
VINRGFGGSQISDSVRLAPRIVLPYKPKLIVFYAGGNDIQAGKSPATVLKDFQAFVKEVHASLPNTRILFISMNPSVARWGKESLFMEGNKLIEGYINRPENKDLHLFYIDTHSKLLSDKGEPRPEILRADGLHLNARGYELWTALLRPMILALASGT